MLYINFFIFSLIPLSISALALLSGYEIIKINILLVILFTPFIFYLSIQFKTLKVIKIFFFSLSIKFSYLLLKYTLIGEKAFVVSGDSQNYVNSVLELNQTKLILTYGTDIGYVYFLKFLNSFFDIPYGSSDIYLVLPNLFFGSLLTTNAYIYIKNSNYNIENKILYLVLLFDFVVLNYSTTVMKDIIVASLISFSFICFKSTRKNYDYVVQFLVLIASILGAFFFRFRSLGINLAVIFFRFMFSKNVSKNVKLFGFSGSLILVSVVVAVVPSQNPFYALNKGKNFFKTEQGLTARALEAGQIDSRQGGRLLGRINSIDNFLIRTSLRTAFSFLVPIPPVQFYQFNIRTELSKFQTSVFKDFGGLFWYFIIPAALLGMYSMIKNKSYFDASFIIFLLLLMGMSGWVDARIRLMCALPMYSVLFFSIGRYKLLNNFSLYFYFSLLTFWIIYEQLF